MGGLGFRSLRFRVQSGRFRDENKRFGDYGTRELQFIGRGLRIRVQVSGFRKYRFEYRFQGAGQS